MIRREMPADQNRKPRKDAEQNAERVMAAAIRAGLAEGKFVPLAKIAADAGVGIATLYRRYPNRDAFASANGTAPLPASSGRTVRHRFNPGGNRQLNRALFTVALTQIRGNTEGRAYYDRKKAAGKSSMEAMRCLKRRLSDLVYRTMLGDYVAGRITTATGQVTGPGGHRGNDSDSSVTGSQPHTGSSDKPLPGPVTTQRRTPLPAAS